MGNLLSRRAVDPNDFEKILGEVDAKIRRNELNLTQIRSSERRFTLLFLAYTCLIYALLILYIFFYPNRPMGNAQIIWDGAMLLAGPFLIYWGKRMLSWYYRKRIGWVEADLKALRAKQKLSVEELKKKTAYYQTKGLLERFDPETKGSPAKKEEQPKPKPVATPPMAPSMNAPVPQMMSQSYQPMQMPPQIPTPIANAPSSIRSPTPSHHQFRVPTWYDRLLDTIIGDDRFSKYALICQQCYTHNGLVLPEDFESTQYVCPNCHFLNPARRPKTPRSPSRLLPQSSGESGFSTPPTAQQEEEKPQSLISEEQSDAGKSTPEPEAKESRLRNRKKQK